jgi:hypothetical protein
MLFNVIDALSENALPNGLCLFNDLALIIVHLLICIGAILHFRT